MPNGSLEREYLRAKTDIRSIFHPNNAENCKLTEDNIVDDPVLLQMIRIARDTACALARIHEKGIIHLDIAARNIMLDARKRPVICDFGYAAIESEMISVYETLISTKSDPEKYAKDRCTYDEEFSRKYKIYSRQKALRWMPAWNYSSPPRVDHKIDIYAFGCVMFELFTKDKPHSKLTDADVEKQKKEGFGIPKVVDTIHFEYSQIMNMCFKDYDEQSTMSEISQKLIDLHFKLSTVKLPKESAYMNIKEFYSNPSLESNYSAILKLRGDKVQIVIRGESYGIGKELLVTALNCACLHRDHKFITMTIEVVVIENEINQIDVLISCLELLGYLLKDHHSSADEEGEYQRVSKIVIQLLKQVTSSKTYFDSESISQLLAEGLTTLNGLLLNKSFNEQGNSEAEFFEDELSSILFYSMKTMPKRLKVIEAVAKSIAGFCSLTRNFMKRLHSGGIVGGLVTCAEIHKRNYSVCAYILKAISCFNAQELLNPISIRDATASSTVNSVSIMKKRLERIKRSNDENVVVPLSYSEINDMKEKWCVVFNLIFTCVEETIERILENRNRSGVADDPFAIFLLEVSTKSMFDICESAANDVSANNKLLLNASKHSIEVLLNGMHRFPDNFKIQEGCIGVLAHILNTGVPIHIRDNQARIRSTIHSPTPLEIRLEAMFNLDPELSLFDKAMGNFQTNSQVSIGLKKSEPNYFRGVSATQLPHQSQTMGINTVPTKTGMTKTVRRDLNFQLSNVEEDDNDEQIFELGEDGEHITAAALQRCAIMIIGSMSNCKKFGESVKELLVHNSYSNRVLQAFGNFKRDVSLIRQGCYTIFYTCRRNEQNKKAFHGTGIVSHLYTPLQKHRTIWSVADGVIIAFVGMMEPNELVCKITDEIIDEAHSSLAKVVETTISENHDAQLQKLMNKSLLAKKQTFIGYKLTALLNSRANATTRHSHLELLGLQVVEFQTSYECFPIVVSFLKLLGCVLFWMPQKLDDWLCGRFLEITSSFDSSKFAQDYNEVVLSAEGRDFTKLIDASSENSNWLNFREFNILQFIFLTLCWHNGSADVVAAALGLICHIFVKLTKEDVVDFKEIRCFQDTRNQAGKLRKRLLDAGFTDLCLLAAQRQEDHPILGRYSLWLLVLMMSTKEVIAEGVCPEEIMASDIRMANCIDWVLPLAESYKEFKSLQTLAIVFLLWMDKYDQLKYSSASQLNCVKQLASRNIASNMPTYISLDDEGHDTTLLDTSIDPFEKLPELSEKLLDIANNYCAQAISVAGKVKAGTSFKAFGDNSNKSDVENDSSSELNETSSMMNSTSIQNSSKSSTKVIVSPKSIAVSGWMNIKPTNGTKQYVVYTLEIYWKGANVWKIQKRFSDMIQLIDTLKQEFSHIQWTCASGDILNESKRQMSGFFRKVVYIISISVICYRLQY